MFTGAHTAATAVDTVAVGANTGVGLLGRIGMAAGAVVTGVMTAAQWALNVALDANPIGLVVIAIAGLIGILILAYTHVTPVRDAINWLWNEIQILWHWIMGGSPGLVPAFQALIGIVQTVINIALLPIKLEFMLLSAAVGAVWNVLQGVGGWLASTFGGILSGTIGTIGRVVSSILGEFGKLPGQLVAIGGQIIGGLISGLLGGIGKIAGAVGQVAGSVVSGFKGLLGIHSPSTVFADQVGGPIVEGIGMGITKSGAAHRALAGLHLTAPNIGGIAAGNMSLSALSGAAAPGAAGGAVVYLTVNNPKPEPASTSTSRELRKLGYLGQAS
jgi:phage-related protein